MANFRALHKNEELKGICKLGYILDFSIAAAAFILVSITSWWVADHFYHMPGIWWLMACYAASIPVFSLSETSRAALYACQRFRWISIFQILDKLILLFLVLWFLLSGSGIKGMIIATALSQAAIGIIMIITVTYLFYRDGIGFWWKGSLKNIIPLRKELSSLFGWNYLFVTLRGLVTYTPQMLLGYFRGPQEAGFYRLATSLATVSAYPESSLRGIAYPLLASHWSQEKPEKLKSILRRWTFYGGIPMSILILLTIPLISIFIPAVFGSQYTPMALAVKIMLAGVMVSALFFWLDIFYYASGKVALWTKGYAFYTAVLIGLGWLFIQQGGFLSLVWLDTISKISFTLIMVMLSARQLSLKKGKPMSIMNGQKAVCFTYWFPRVNSYAYNNPRHAVAVSKLAWLVKLHTLTFGRQRLLRGEWRLWHILRRPLIYPIVLRYLSRRYPLLFTFDLHQIPEWPRQKSVVVDLDDPIFSPAEVKLLNLPQVKAVIVTTQKAKTIFQELGVVQPIYVIAQGAEMEYINAKNVERIRLEFKGKDDIVVGYHAAILSLSSDSLRSIRQRIDDLDFLFSTVEQARKDEPRIKLWLFGKPSKSVKKYVFQRKNSWIKLFGYVPLSRILNYVSNFDIGAYPRTTMDFVRFRVKIAHYMACRVPVVSTGAEETMAGLIREARCGIVCNSGEDFSGALVKLAQSPQLRQNLGEAGHRYASENLNWSMLIKHYEELLKD